MVAIGMVLLWSAYTLILFGVCLFKTYQITLSDLVIPGRWTGGWPPPTAGSDTGGGTGTGTSGGSGSGSGGPPGERVSPGAGGGSGGLGGIVGLGGATGL